MNKMILCGACVVLVWGCDISDGASGEDDETEADSTIDTSGEDTETAEDTNIGTFAIDVSRASDFNPEAPGTVGIVTWSIQDVVPDTAAIHFGLDTRYGMVAPVDLNEPDFRTLLLGMKPSRTYHFQVVARAGAASARSGSPPSAC